MLDWIKLLLQKPETKRKIKYLEEIIQSRKNIPRQGFDETLLVAQYSLAAIYSKINKNKARKLLNNAIKEFYELIREENKKTKLSRIQLKLYEEDQFHERELAIDKIKIYEQKLLNAAQKIEQNPKFQVNDIAFGTNNLKKPSKDYKIEKLLKELKIYDLENIVQETKYDGRIKYADNKDVLDKKNLYLYS